MLFSFQQTDDISARVYIKHLNYCQCFWHMLHNADSMVGYCVYALIGTHTINNKVTCHVDIANKNQLNKLDLLPPFVLAPVSRPPIAADSPKLLFRFQIFSLVWARDGETRLRGHVYKSADIILSRLFSIFILGAKHYSQNRCLIGVVAHEYSAVPKTKCITQQISFNSKTVAILFVKKKTVKITLFFYANLPCVMLWIIVQCICSSIIHVMFKKWFFKHLVEIRISYCNTM